MALFLQGNKTEKGFLETTVRVLLIFYTANSVPQHFTKFKTGIGEALVCRAGVEGKGRFMILIHTFAMVIQAAKRILCVLVILIRRQGEPIRRLQIVLLCAKSGGIHFADTVLGVLPRFFFLGSMENSKGLFVPAVCFIGVRFAAKTIRRHSAQVT
ncbi:hypothetical protein SDC9_67622 [bioreactor metagenome]|uniref:Uncharacterized protein n=1 Tax=bioreactor metagenome TaxID=1076179 RepID=A0A644XYK1_9ZZZZ